MEEARRRTRDLHKQPIKALRAADIGKEGGIRGESDAKQKVDQMS